MRLTAEQFEERWENRVTGAYTVKPPNTFRRGRKKAIGPCEVCRREIVGPHCENCGRETEYLFPGFKSMKSAGLKFRLGERVRVSREGQSRGYGSRSSKTGVVAAFCRDTDLVKIRKDGCSTAETYHIDFWQPINPMVKGPSSPSQTESITVCAVCRPPSNWEIEEILHGQ